jgi:hypothetical protein
MLVQGSRFKGAGLSPSSTASGIRDVRCRGRKTKAIDHLGLAQGVGTQHRANQGVLTLRPPQEKIFDHPLQSAAV